MFYFCAKYWFKVDLVVFLLGSWCCCKSCANDWWETPKREKQKKWDDGLEYI